MSEGSDHAAILIATSYQALNRAVQGNKDTLITDCTVLILFAGFYIEATLNHILESTELQKQMDAFPLRQHSHNRRNYPGMKDKLAWFYNEFVEESTASNWDDIRTSGIEAKLRTRFPGFSEIHRFRNDISHGRINETAKSLATAQRLRQQAKDIVTQLYIITSNKGYTVPRLITYRDAIASLSDDL
jgi:hypothetical protein